MILGTKSQTLNNLSKVLEKSKIEQLYFFKVSEWNKNKKTILSHITKEFNDKIIVRSSTLVEDTTKESKAGCFASILNVNPKKPTFAINKVISTYDDNPDNEVLIQLQTNVETSGVIFTSKRNGAPYYVINYDTTTSNTETVTGGSEGKKMEILRNINTLDLEHPWYNLIESVREIEYTIPTIPLDIEFGIDWDGNVVIFQVRPLIVKPHFVHTTEILETVKYISNKYQKGKIYSDMAFWNPSEIIGDRPNKLDYSLYRYLITKDIWNISLVEMGYTNVGGELMVEFAGKPYIDLIKSLNALLPQSIENPLRKKIIDYSIQKVYSHPELHDKIEFDVIPNCYHHNFNEVLDDLEKAGFSDKEREELEQHIQKHTEFVLSAKDNWFKIADADLIHMERNRRKLLRNCTYKNTIETIDKLLEDCKTLGIRNFVIMARLAFMAKISLDSMVRKGWVTKRIQDRYLSSIKTVASAFDGTLTYGHLRPGTYDITSPRYDKNPEIRPIDSISLRTASGDLPTVLKMEKKFISKAIKARENVKFEFTKNISEVLELIATLGSFMGFTREDVSYLDINVILNSAGMEKQDMKELWSAIISGRKIYKYIYETISLPSLIFSREDFYIVKSHTTKPNFITEKKVIAPVCNLEKDKNIKEKIVFISNADPGYDWIFSKNIKGLVTCYGGVASHMAIRCAEFGIPAAIGCGKLRFQKLINKKIISLDCSKGVIE